MKQDIRAEMKDKASGGRVGYGSSLFSIHLRHALLYQKGVHLKTRADVIDLTSAHGIVLRVYTPPKRFD